MPSLCGVAIGRSRRSTYQSDQRGGGRGPSGRCCWWQGRATLAQPRTFGRRPTKDPGRLGALTSRWAGLRAANGNLEGPRAGRNPSPGRKDGRRWQADGKSVDLEAEEKGVPTGNRTASRSPPPTTSSAMGLIASGPCRGGDDVRHLQGQVVVQVEERSTTTPSRCLCFRQARRVLALAFGWCVRA